MILISHRGSTYGPNEEYQNDKETIDRVIEEGYHVEIDVWKVNNQLYLGHDYPEWLHGKIESKWLIDRKDVLLCHAKNVQSLQHLLDIDTHCFWHEEDKYTITNRGIIIAYPGISLPKGSICMRPEEQVDWSQCWGICSDYIERYK